MLERTALRRRAFGVHFCADGAGPVQINSNISSPEKFKAGLKSDRRYAAGF
jgi:hypothetical protein